MILETGRWSGHIDKYTNYLFKKLTQYNTHIKWWLYAVNEECSLILKDPESHFQNLFHRMNKNETFSLGNIVDLEIIN